jgi:hypothetical protein
MPTPPRYVEFQLEDGGSILIETPDPQEKVQSGFVKGAQNEGGRDAALQASRSFEASTENVRKAAELLVNKLRTLSAPPDEMTVSFNIKASDLGSLAIAKLGAEANYGVQLKWRKEEKKTEEPKPGEKKDEPAEKKDEPAKKDEKEEGEHKA